MNGKTGTFAMTMPSRTMPVAGCSGQASGAFDMDDTIVLMHGSCAGSATGSGPFTNGQMTMSRK
jgi:hypothetical protein